MRTTLNIDDDVLAAVQERARRENRTAGEVLSELARLTLTGRVRHSRPDVADHGIYPLPNRGPAVSNAHIDTLREDDAE